MHTTVKRLLLGGAACCLVAGVAIATPSIGASFYNLVLSTGTAERDIHAHASVKLPDEEFGAELHTYGASNFIVHDIKISPGGTTGWHTHPGIVMLTLAADSGPIEWYDAHCGKTTYKAGDAWTETTRLHDVVNAGGIDAHFFITYIVPKGVAKRTDEAAPRCAQILGLR